MGSSKLLKSPQRRMGDRNVLCVHYEECLDLAVSRKWRTFSCDRCAYLNHQYIPRPDELDIQPYLSLIVAILEDGLPA